MTSTSTTYKFNKENDEVVSLRDKSPTPSSGSDNIPKNESFLSKHINRSSLTLFSTNNDSTR